MRNKKLYTPQEAAEIARAYNGFCSGGRHENVVADGRYIPSNVREILQVDWRISLLEEIVKRGPPKTPKN